MGRWDEIDKLVETVYHRFGRVSILVNDAGKSPLYENLIDVNEAMWDSVLGLNLKGAFWLSAIIGDRMAKSDGGSIKNISSVAAVRPSAREVPYSAAMAGLNALTMAFANAYGPKVRMNCIMPGPFLTDISKAWNMEEMSARLENLSNLKRAGNPEEIIGAALYYASDASSFATGTILPLDGGYKK